ncbi:MAG: alpha-galactosidase, partial [Sedimentisphaerales bacterium]|nr:alpha-galactosidase [Sedimentisphaerales bacterium]
LILDHYSPRPGGVLVDPPVAASVHGTYCFECTSQANMTKFIEDIDANSLPVEYIWIDAGWYNLNGHGGETNAWVWVGTWEPDPVRYPNGMKPVADEAHSHGYKFLLWFEPERVTEGSWIMLNHPDWVLKANDWPLLNLGNPAALAWAKDHFSTMIGSIGVDCYRHDFNVFPLTAWRNNDAADRQGMNEIKHIMGLYEYFDYLQAQHPNLIIDNCASGGRRIDFEMLKRAVTLTRTDYLWYSDSAQAMQYALSNWIPLTGLGTVSTSPYDFRSGMGSHLVTAFNNTDGSMWAPAIAQLNTLNSIRHLFRGDFYPLTGYSLENDIWIAWQYDRPDIGQGLVQAFRRPGSLTATSMTFKLQGLEPAASYTVTNLDGGTSTKTGNELMNTGLSITIPASPGSALIRYTKN